MEVNNQQMYYKNKKIKDIPHLGAGVNTSDANSEIMDYEMATCLNWEVNEKTLRTSAGWVDYGSVEQETPIYGGFEARFEDGTHIMIRQKGTILEKDNGAGSWTEVENGLTEARCTFTMLNDTILWSNGIDDIKSSTDGTTWTDQAGLPKSKKIVHNGKNRIVFANQPDAPSKISWSNINDPLTVDASSYQFIGKNDGEQVLDVVVTEKGGIYVFKTTRVYEIGDVSFDMIGVDPIGKLAYIPFTAVATENSVMATAFDGIYEIVGGTINLISKNIKRGSIQPKNTDTAVCSYFKNKYRVSLPINQIYNDTEIVVDRKQPTGNPFNPYAITFNTREIGDYIYEQNYYGTTMRHRLYVGGSRIGTFAWLNTNHNKGVQQGILGNNQTCMFETKFFTFNSPFFIKRFLRYFISLSADEDIDVEICYRFDSVGQYICTNLTGATGEFPWEGDYNFDEGYGFSSPLSDEQFISLEKTGVPRGIQFKVTVTTKKDLTILSQAFSYSIKPRFH